MLWKTSKKKENGVAKCFKNNRSDPKKERKKERKLQNCFTNAIQRCYDGSKLSQIKSHTQGGVFLVDTEQVKIAYKRRELTGNSRLEFPHLRLILVLLWVWMYVQLTDGMAWHGMERLFSLALAKLWAREWRLAQRVINIYSMDTT